MILDKEKQEAWMALGSCVALGEFRWLSHLSQEQIDYLKTDIDRRSFPGERGKKLRSISRWNSLDFAFSILKARRPDQSDRKICEAVGEHYRCHWSTVRKARSRICDYGIGFADRHKQLGFTDADFAELTLPHINFDNFSDE